jgi:hypothetical protein
MQSTYTRLGSITRQDCAPPEGLRARRFDNAKAISQSQTVVVPLRIVDPGRNEPVSQ